MHIFFTFRVVQASVKITRTALSVLHLVLECITPPSVKRCAPMSKLLLYWKLQVSTRKITLLKTDLTDVTWTV